MKRGKTAPAIQKDDPGTGWLFTERHAIAVTKALTFTGLPDIYGVSIGRSLVYSGNLSDIKDKHHSFIPDKNGKKAGVIRWFCREIVCPERSVFW